MPLCPKCNIELDELEQDYSEMTEGQRANYDGGFSRPFACPECGHWALYDIEVNDYEPDFEEEQFEELIRVIKVSPDSFEEVIENALNSRCFIEATSLIHNVIEGYLRYKLEVHFASDKDKLALLKNRKYLKDYNEFCYLFGLINKKEFDDICKFNADRNRMIHELLKKTATISELRAVARRGREIQARLSPLNHTEEDIKRIMIEFDNLTE